MTPQTNSACIHTCTHANMHCSSTRLSLAQASLPCPSRKEDNSCTKAVAMCDGSCMVHRALESLSQLVQYDVESESVGTVMIHTLSVYVHVYLSICAHDCV
jgi:hypothetical protein